ncbi:peptidoglycan-binding domain-containing protein [Streptomyces acidiscabies]|uniref:Peptidoglycan-binding domain-containing protein n=1 Tax=Streptomyces acidiscabies TaxID=42234 RepID=A0AAP6EJB1_9ACTN|nr:peptidoglycan-binding domain-containing protein [Streptomyces acidiscabies]MBP5937447.1 peptidoglycan-binding protein [Streptomyces sp. LBUM 1476]MBZ3914473.1 peptidoglycan-binding protein [Streptomyces acidiscabies]MDX2964340.1 peptidoglycan-binding domain-containing protein [Streptomyces acidiscabies]MDX3017161.1 peptidoglycan-binding domain-containing protein [Streptomyces acidiscabies]MDX3789112.1 peptidoglycan-binding domain-containing protein [Streptomyces acidiscabies]
MRRLVLSKALVSAAAVVGLAAGGLATAAPSFAAPAAQERVVGAEAASTHAVVNFGLSRAQAKNVQRWLAEFWGYDDAVDGLLGAKSWKAYQRCLQNWGYTGPIDGIVGDGTIRALQTQLQSTSGYAGPVDGYVGPLTRAAFARFADDHA